ncbi:MAG TPA: amino acid permease, partial [Terriglobales bacterium]
MEKVTHISTVPAAAGGLQRQLGLASATAAVAGEAIAVGIFLTPANMAKSLGSPLWLLAVWLLIGAMTVCGALCYGELAGRFPRPGGTYVYLEETYGRGLAFLYGWMCMLVLDPGVTASLGMGIALYAAYIFHWPTLVIKLAGIGIIWSLCISNILSVRVSAGVLRWMTWLKLSLLGLLVVWAFAFRLGSWSNFVPLVEQRGGSLPLAAGLGVGMMSAFYSFGGWWDVSKITGEVRDPARTLPRALLLGVLIVTAAYVLVSAVFWYLVPLEKVASDEAFVAQAGEVLFGPAGGAVFAVIVIVCILGSLAALVISAPRVYYAMARDGLFVPAVARVHPRFGTPALAVVIQGSISSLLVALGTFQQIVAYFVFIAVVFLALTVASVFVLRSRSIPAGESAMLTPAYPLPPLLFVTIVVL